MSLKTPIAFIIFNRPDLTAIVFKRIREAQPKKLFVIADGPRSSHPEDMSKCKATRDIIDKGIDWPCEVYKNYSNINLGCGKRISSGIDWVFNNVEESIILEDDCLPDISFFDYTENLLNIYENDTRVMQIGGTSWNPSSLPKPDSYFFTCYPISWGWATWKRAWTFYDFNMTSWLSNMNQSMIYSPFSTDIEKNRRKEIWNQTYEGQIDTWDYQWFYSIRLQNGICISPRKNLIKNIGLRSDGTHTLSADHHLCNLPVYNADKPLSHPVNIIRNAKADIIYEAMASGLKLPWRSRIKKQIKRLLKK